MKVGIIGMGFMGVTHFHAWKATPAHIVGTFTESSREPDLDIAQFSDLDELINAVDVVDICTPTYTHHELVLKVARAGKHIICEKPLARTVTQAEEMVQACEDAGVQLLVAHVVRFFPEYALAQQTVSGGGIGDVAVTRLTRASFKPGTPDSWFHDHSKSGGMVMDLMIHDLDYARWISGDVKSVFARSAAKQFDGVDGDYCLAILTHENGALSHVEGGWIYPAGMFRTALEIAGSQGLIEHPHSSSVPLGIHLKATDNGTEADIAVPSSPLSEDPYTTEIKHFYDALTQGITPRVSARDALEAVRLAIAIQQSVETGKPVIVAEVQ